MNTIASAPLSRSPRLLSIDFLRGLVMFIMALDHVRDFIHRDSFLYDPLDPEKTSIILYITRWITHFCAPTFVLLSGVAAYLYGRQRPKKELSFFLFTRGLWLVFVDLVIVSFSWGFNPPPHYILFGVVAVIGASMMVLALLIYLPKTVILLFGLILIFFHNSLDPLQHSREFSSFGWSLLHQFGFFLWGNHFTIQIGYPLIPWAGVLALGYCMGTLFEPGYDPWKRKKILGLGGTFAVLLFIFLRFFNIYGDPSVYKPGATVIESLMIFFRVLKYPPSLLYLLITLGPVLLLLSRLKDDGISPSNPLVIFGRVPLFYYVIHLYIIHLIGVLVALSSGHPFSDMVADTFIFNNKKLAGTYGLSLFWVYVIWILLAIALYPLCRWYADFKSRHRNWRWLSYF
jgi:uncharacterized membrane protein